MTAIATTPTLQSLLADAFARHNLTVRSVTLHETPGHLEPRFRSAPGLDVLVRLDGDTDRYYWGSVEQGALEDDELAEWVAERVVRATAFLGERGPRWRGWADGTVDDAGRRWGYGSTSEMTGPDGEKFKAARRAPGFKRRGK